MRIWDIGRIMANLRLSIFIAMVLSGLAVAVILPILAPLVRALGLSESQGGAIVSAGALAMVLTGPFWGRLSDRSGRKSVMVIGFLGISLGYVAYTLAVWVGLVGVFSGVGLFVLLLVARTIVGVFLPAVPAASQALMADITTKEDRSSGMALIGVANGLGMIIGPAIGGALAIWGLIWPLVMTILVCALAFVVFAWRMPKTAPKASALIEKLNPFDPAIFLWLVAAFVIAVAIVTAQMSAGFYFQDSLGLTIEQAGPRIAIALILVGVAMIATQVLQIKVLKWAPHRLVITGGILWAIGFTILILGGRLEIYFAAYAVLGIAGGFLIPGYMSGISLAVGEERQGAVAGLLASAQGMAGIVTPIGSTLLYQTHQTSPFWLVVVLMIGLALWVGLVALKQAGEKGQK